MKAVGTQEIKTERLLLRQFTRGDVDAVYENYGSDPKVKRYINYAPCATREAAGEFIKMHLEKYETDPDFYGWAVTLDNIVIGSVGLFDVDYEKEACELGYSIGSRWWGSGYGTEAAGAVLQYGFEQIGAKSICASHHIENTASGRVLTKIGMIREGILKDGQRNADGSFSDLVLYVRKK